MKVKNTIEPKTKVKVSTKQIARYTAVAGGIGVFIFIVSFLFNNLGTPTAIFASGEPPGYSWSKTIKVDSSKVAGSVDMVNFPILIDITDNDLKTISNGGKVTSSSGYDIVFADELGNTLDVFTLL